MEAVSVWEDEKVLETTVGWFSVNILNATELFT